MLHRLLFMMLALGSFTPLLPYSITLHNTSEDPVTFVFIGYKKPSSHGTDYSSSTQERGEIARLTVRGATATRPSGASESIDIPDDTCIAKVEVWNGDHQVFPDGLPLVHPEGCRRRNTYVNHITYCAPENRSSTLFYTKTSDDYNAIFPTTCGSHNN